MGGAGGSIVKLSKESWDRICEGNAKYMLAQLERSRASDNSPSVVWGPLVQPYEPDPTGKPPMDWLALNRDFSE